MRRAKQLLTAVLLIILIPLSALAENFGAVILYDHSSVKFFKDGRKIFKEEMAVKITGKRGIKNFGEIVIPFSTEHQKVKILYAYTVTPNGKKIYPDKKAYNVVYPPFVSEAPIYSDLKYQTISMPAVTPGSVIKYAYEIETFKPYMKNEFWEANFFQGEYPVKEATFTVYIPEGKYFKYKCYNMNEKEATPQIKEEKHFKVLLWKLTNVPPIETEPSMPPIGEIAKKVSITSLKSWQQVAKWYSELAKDAVKPDKTIKELAARLTAGKKTKKEKIQAIYNFVSQNIRYVGMEFGINGYKPHKAPEILKNRYGDCKDHATLLIAMLKAAGIKGYPVLIPTSGKSNMDKALPMPTAFNHEIAAVNLNGKIIYMDTTSDFVPFGYLPPGDQGRNVLMIDVEKEKGYLEETPVAPPSVNVEQFKGNFSLNSSGELEGNFSFIYKGVYSMFERARLITATKPDIKRHVENLASSISPGFNVVGYQLSDYKNLNIPDVTISIKGYDNEYATLTSHFLLAKLPVPSFSRLVSLVAEKKRKYPYVVGYKMSKEIEAEIKIPPGYKLYLKPEDFAFKNRVGFMSLKWKAKPQVISMNLKLILNKHIIPVEEYTDLRDLFNTFVKTIRNEVIILEKEQE